MFNKILLVTESIAESVQDDINLFTEIRSQYDVNAFDHAEFRAKAEYATLLSEDLQDLKNVILNSMDDYLKRCEILGIPALDDLQPNEEGDIEINLTPRPADITDSVCDCGCDYTGHSEELDETDEEEIEDEE